VRPTVCGLTGSESLIVNVPVRVPTAVGVNLTPIVQDAPPARLDPQVLVCEKSPLFVPAMRMLEMLNAAVPRFFKVTLLAALVVPTVRLAKVIVAGDTVTPVPVPLKLTVWGLPMALSVTLMAAALAPTD
jgi:hypothetical protein